jgi:hypothetical protein
MDLLQQEEIARLDRLIKVSEANCTAILNRLDAEMKYYETIKNKKAGCWPSGQNAK